MEFGFPEIGGRGDIRLGYSGLTGFTDINNALEAEAPPGIVASVNGSYPLNVRAFIEFEDPVYGVGATVGAVGMNGRGASVTGTDGFTLRDSVVTGDIANPFSFGRFAGWVSDDREIVRLNVTAFTNSGLTIALIAFNQIDLLTVAPNSEPPFGPGLDPEESGMNPVPEPNSIFLFAVGGVNLLGCRWRSIRHTP